MAKKKPKPASPEAEVSSPVLSDGWISFILFMIFLAVCALIWLGAWASSIPGAPGAPLG